MAATAPAEEKLSLIRSSLSEEVVERLNAYFENGAATPPYDYATTPNPCG